MKIRKGSMSNSNSSSFAMVYDRDYYRHSDDPSCNNKPKNYTIKDTDTITISEYIEHCDLVRFYTLTKKDMEEFFSEWKEDWKDIGERVFINAEEIDVEDIMTKAWPGKYLLNSGIHGIHPSVEFDILSDTLDEFVEKCSELRKVGEVHST